MSEDRADLIRELTARAEADPLPVIALTDEEVVALGGGPADPGPVPLPWLAGRDTAALELACQVAMRGLAARRLVVPLGPDEGFDSGPGDGRQYVALHDDLRAVLAMRHSARAVVFALRQSDERARLIYQGATGALEEAISPGGLHGFTVVAHADAVERLAAFADPAEAAPADLSAEPAARSRVVPLAEIARGAKIPVTGARSVTMVTRLAFDATAAEQRLTVYAKEAGVVVASPADAGEAPALRFAEVDRSGLRDCLAGLLDVPGLGVRAGNGDRP
jgi:hypothetical protein